MSDLYLRTEYEAGRIDRAEFIVRLRALDTGWGERKIQRKIATRRAFREIAERLQKLVDRLLK